MYYLQIILHYFIVSEMIMCHNKGGRHVASHWKRHLTNTTVANNLRTMSYSELVTHHIR